MILSEAQDRLLRLISYRNNPEGKSIIRLRMAGFSDRSMNRLVQHRLARTVDRGLWLVSTRRGEVQIALEDERIARAIRRARKRGNP